MRNGFITAVTCSLLLSWPSIGGEENGTAAKQFTQYRAELVNVSSDLITIAKSLKGLDSDIAQDLIDVADVGCAELDNISDLLTIKDLVLGREDRERILPLIASRIDFVSKKIPNSVDRVNLSISYTHHQGVILSASQIRDTLRKANDLLTRASTLGIDE
ncbi:MAG: hypothetical protein RBU21_02730 [FCB group bacterium]|jgi:hypothetical protein|nr:hypothetical protein [FCB group bacterium]